MMCREGQKEENGDGNLAVLYELELHAEIDPFPGDANRRAAMKFVKWVIICRW